MLTFRQDSNFYANARLLAINTEAFKPNIYYDTLGIPTTGYGYAMVIITNKTTNTFERATYDVPEFSAIGITLTKANTDALDAIAKNLSDGNVSTAKSQVTTLDAQVADINSTQADTLFTFSYGRAMTDVKTAFIKHLGVVKGMSLFNAMSNSTEMIAIADMAYNGSSGLIGANLSNALWNNRAEAWYEIRYQSNKDADQGHANRRYLEALKFSLYDNNVTKAEAEQVAQMYTAHRLEVKGILDYEKTYSPVTANNNYNPKPGI
jgi:GH24 family phage-related lysozyme (muramidase)